MPHAQPRCAYPEAASGCSSPWGSIPPLLLRHCEKNHGVYDERELEKARTAHTQRTRHQRPQVASWRAVNNPMVLSVRNERHTQHASNANINPTSPATEGKPRDHAHKPDQKKILRTVARRKHARGHDHACAAPIYQQSCGHLLTYKSKQPPRAASRHEAVLKTHPCPCPTE